MEPLFERLQASIASFAADSEAPDYERAALHLAVWVHARIIRIHPFEDGNGRTSRLFMNWVLTRLGLRPIAIEVPRQEYLDCLNRYYHKGEITPLVDLCLRLYPLG